MDRFKLMETYETVVKAGSFTAAAKALGVTSAMVSKRIQDLEAGLRVKLLNRNTHRLNLTDSGAAFYDRCVTLLAEVRRLEESMRGSRRLAQGEINILCTRSFAETLLAPVFADFCAAHPAITLKITSMDRALAPRPTDLIHGGYDVAIRTLTIRDSSLMARRLLDVPQVLVAAPDYIARAGRPGSPTDLADHNCFDPAHTADSFTWDFQGPGGRMSVRVSGSLRTNSASVVRHAALRGLGIALLRRDLVAHHLADGSLEEVLRGHRAPAKTFYVVYQKDVQQPQRIRLFVDFLTRRMRTSARR
ncbi:MAG: LysR family transcriptional regulator [Gemmatimonas sp.]